MSAEVIIKAASVAFAVSCALGDAQAQNRVTSATGDPSTGFSITQLTKISEVRVGRTVYDYTYRVGIRNNGTAGATVQAQLISVPPGTTIIDGQVAAGFIAAGSTVTPASDTVVLRIDRNLPFSPTALSWSFTFAAAQALGTVKPAQVVVLSLADLGLPNASTVAVSGAISEALIRDGTLRFWTPGDTGVPQNAEFIVTGSGGESTVLQQPITTERPSLPLAVVEPDENGVTGTPSSLTVTGLGPNNSIGSSPLTFRIQGMLPMDLGDDSDGFIAGLNNAGVSLKPFWSFNSADNSFTISGTRLQSLLSVLPTGPLTMSLNFVSKDGEFAVSYDLLAVRLGASINGRLVTSSGAAVTDLVGKRILLRGFNQRLRQAALIDGSGQFSFSNVIPDTYQLTLNDLNRPNVVTASSVIFPGTTTASVTIVYSDATQNRAGATSQPYASSSVVQDGSGPPERGYSQSTQPTLPSAVNTGAGAATFSATAAAQNSTITSPISFSVPQGTRQVNAKIQVFTAEYPVYTTQQSQFNDTWAYSVTGLPGTSLSASGSVNQSHYTQGTVSKTVCVDVTDQTKSASISLGGTVSATNIGDSALPTTTSVTLSTECSGLKVSEAKFLSPNDEKRPVLQPVITTGNLPGPYLSVPISTAAVDATHKLPLEISFTPADAEISEVNISVASGSQPSFASKNLLDYPHSISSGKIKIDGISLPVFAAANTTGKVAVTVRIKGTVESVPATSDPDEGGQVAFDDTTAFVPLYLAGSETGLGQPRRYGARDAGGDSWATRGAITWLQARQYRFDDTSGQHVIQCKADDTVNTCNSTIGRSFLGHAGHSDGQQIDMRYADGQGGYTEALGGVGNGASISEMINAAKLEVTTNAPQKPQLARLQAWITANRAMLDAEATRSETRKIHIGTSFIKLALVDGKFPGTPSLLIPNVSAWMKPAKVSVIPGHLHHWHVSLTAHP